jgi:type II secretory pathway component PulJ
LVEILVSLVIVSLLVIVIFQTYKSIADISVRVDNIYKMTNEMLFAHQTIQNLVDVGQLDVDKRFE